MMGNKIFLIWLLAIASTIALVYAPTEQTSGTPSNVTVQTTIAISLSTNMTDGLFNSTMDAGSSNNQDPGMGGDGIGTTNAGNNVTVSSNTDVKLCIRDNANLTLRSDSTKDIPNFNYTWYQDGNKTNISSTPSMNFTTSFVVANASVPNTGVTYFGFWVDIPAAQTAGEYNNTVEIKGVRSALGC